MAYKLNFESAKLYYVTHREHVNELTWPEFERCEAVILSEPVTDADRAAAILQVIIDQGGEGRSDGLELTALAGVLGWVKSLARRVSPAAARAA